MHPGGYFLPSTALLADNQEQHVKSFLAEEGTHPYSDLIVLESFNIVRDEHRLAVSCAACEREWVLEVSRHTLMEGRSFHNGILERHLVPYFKRIARTLCFKLSLEAELAEWLTTRVANAHPHGVTFAALAAEAVEEHFCGIQDVDAMLSKLGFMRDWECPPWSTRTEAPLEVHMVAGHLVNNAWIHLPEGHPLRKDGNG